MLTMESVARVAHAANSELRRIIGEEPMQWVEMDERRRQGLVEAAHKAAIHRWLSPAEAHSDWVISMTEQGWSYGPYNPDEKTHPNMQPWENLPVEQRAKDRMFLGIVRALT